MLYQEKIQNMDHVKESIRDVYARITSDVLQQACHDWDRRCQCNGVHISTFHK